MKFIADDLTGKRFGKLTVIKRVHNEKNKHARWLCKCDCGNEVVVQSQSLKKSTKSCGCLLVELHLTHGQAGTRLYNIWNVMKQRCGNPNNHNYKEYGARGISVCEDWKRSFETFQEWAMKTGYNPDLKRGECTLDRINNDGNYCPENCRWVTMKEQCQNRRRPNNWKPKQSI